jgi:hypothetical protein
MRQGIDEDILVAHGAESLQELPQAKPVSPQLLGRIARPEHPQGSLQATERDPDIMDRFWIGALSDAGLM